MRYWEEMNDKFGFGDGGAEPADARVARSAYLLYINAMAIAKKSRYRQMAYDRPGMHNSCMILQIDVIDSPVADVSAADWTDPDEAERLFHKLNAFREKSPAPPLVGEDPMETIIPEAFDQQLDEFVRIRVRLDDVGLHKLIDSQLKPAAEAKKKRGRSS